VSGAGNDHTNSLHYPACYDGVICVGAVNENGEKTEFSNFGPQITVAAPGWRIAAPITASDNVSNSTYEASNGTSHATAVTSGFLALYMSKYGVISPKESMQVVKKYTVRGPKDLGAGIISFEKMFVNDKEAPEIAVFDKDGNRIEDLKSPVPEESTIRIFDAQAGNNDVIVYTTDGRMPAIRNGAVAVGTVYDPEQPIEIDSLERDKTVTVRAIIVNSLRVASKTNTVKVKTPKP
jgi:hypothetical protein